MFKLFINNEEAELNKKTKIQFNRIILDISDISKRGINITNAINLPFSKKNDRLTGFPSRLNFNNASFETYQNYSVTQDNNIVSTGQMLVQSFDEKKGIKVQMAEGYDFWDEINKKRLIDLDLFEYDREFNNASFNALDEKTDSPWLWALGSFASDINETALNNLQYSRPMYRDRRILDIIISQAGYTVEYNNTFEETIIDDIGIISNSQDFSVSDYVRLWENVDISLGDILQTSGSLEFSENGNVVLSGNNLINETYTTSYVIKGTVNSFRASILSITYTLNGVSTVERFNIPAGISFINFRSEEIEIDSETVFSIDDNVTFENIRIYSHINESHIVEIEEDWKGNGQNSILNNYLMLTDYNLPEMTQGEFFKTIIKRLFLKVDIDNLKKVVQIMPFSDILSTNNAIDMSNKSKRFPPYKSGKSFGQLNIMSYSNEDNISNDIGRATFNVENQTAIQSKVFINIDQYSASREIQVDDNTTVNVPIYSITPATRESVKDRVVSFIEGDGIPFSASFGLVGWQNLYSDYYLSFINSVKRERIIDIELIISFLDFININKRPIIYIGELGSYFLVLTISGFIDGEFTKLSIIKFV